MSSWILHRFNNKTRRGIQHFLEICLTDFTDLTIKLGSVEKQIETIKLSSDYNQQTKRNTAMLIRGNRSLIQIIHSSPSTSFSVKHGVIVG